MIRVERPAPYGLDEFPDGVVWKSDSDGDLTIKGEGGTILATYRDGYWASVRQVADQ